MYTGLGRTAAELREDARILYANAQRAFDAGDFTAALALFREAYQVRQEPLVVMAIATTLFRLGRMEEAAASYRDYLRLDPRGPEVARAQSQLRIVSAGVPVQATRQTPVFAESAQPAVPPIVPQSPYGSSDVDSLVIIGVAGAGIVAIGLAAWALSRRRSQPNRRRARRLHRRAA